MNPQKAVALLINAVETAQKRGAYSLEEAEQIAQAVKVFIKQEAPKEAPKEKPKKK